GFLRQPNRRHERYNRTRSNQAPHSAPPHDDPPRGGDLLSERSSGIERTRRPIATLRSSFSFEESGFITHCQWNDPMRCAGGLRGSEADIGGLLMSSPVQLQDLPRTGHFHRDASWSPGVMLYPNACGLWK